jgi:energy-coupling factor transporter ATP-binding protein EcfA2
MALLEIKELSFTYPDTTSALREINLQIHSGEFVALMGTTGSGKTTLMKMLKNELRPHGSLNGEILYAGQPLWKLEPRRSAAEIGYVMQNPEQQIVTDKVYHELAFGLENLGLHQNEIRSRVGEMASYFGIDSWFHRDTFQLSGGEKQLLNLASILVLRPQLLLLDEATAQLDPIAALHFLNTLKRINQELGITILLAEHRLETVFSLCDRVLVMDQGRIIADDSPRRIATQLNHPDLDSELPSASRIFRGLGGGGECPLTVREGRDYLSRYSAVTNALPEREEIKAEAIIELKDLCFSYQSNQEVLRDLSLTIKRGETLALLGGNGSGKTTLLKIIAGLLRPHQGKVLLQGRRLKDYPGNSLYTGLLTMLPQDPSTLFIEDEVLKDLKTIPGGDVERIVSELELEDFLHRHPYDLSGGEQQQVALGKVLLTKPQILLLDEPTKGLDGKHKRKLKVILETLRAKGVTIILVSHDLDFVARVSDRCGLLFDGEIIAVASPRKFFSGNNFYTTSANRLARHRYQEAITEEEVIALALENGAV